MIRYHAAWIVPIAGPPLADGWVAVDRGRIAAVGHRSLAGDGSREIDLGAVALMPGLVNAHTHLELSYLRDRIPASSCFTDWIRAIVAARRGANPRAPEVLEAIDGAIGEALAYGTAVVGDVSNTLVTFDPLARSPLAALVFYELIGFNPQDPAAVVARAVEALEALPSADRVRSSLAPHAPHSVAPLLFRAIRQAIERDPFAPSSVHVAESADEVEFIKTGGGPWRAFLEEVGAWNVDWVAPGVSPVHYLDDCGFLDARVLAVHGVQMTATDFARLAATRVTLVTCPRSNQRTGAGVPSVDQFFRAGLRVAVGTDSLASVPDLNVFAELRAMRALAPDVPASALLESATYQGARALGFEAEYGTIEPGKAARLLAIDLPGPTPDVEEYLVSGIGRDQVRWVE